VPPRNLLVLGGWNPVSPRHRVLARGLEEGGIRTETVPLPGRALRRMRTLASLPAGLLERADLVFLPKVAQLHAPFTRLVRRRAPGRLVADYFVSLHMTEIDRKRAHRAPIRSFRSYLLDRLLSLGADHFITDTAAHRDALAARYGLPADRTTVVPVGAEPVAVPPPRDRRPSDPLEVLFVGHFIPLHGIEVVLEAARILGNDSGVRFTLIGDGQTRPEAERTVRRMGVSSITFLPPVSYQELAGPIENTDVMLGIFSTGLKAQLVVPKKAYLALAAARCLVTADTPAARECLAGGENALLVRPGHAPDLAEALAALRDAPPLCRNLGAAGHRLYRRRFTPRRIADAFLTLPAWRGSGLEEAA